MNWKPTKTLSFSCLFLSTSCSNRFMLIKSIASHINEVESNNEVNFQQEEIKVPTSILNNQSVKGIKLEQITGAIKKTFSSKD